MYTINNKFGFDGFDIKMTAEISEGFAYCYIDIDVIRGMDADRLMKASTFQTITEKFEEFQKVADKFAADVDDNE